MIERLYLLGAGLACAAEIGPLPKALTIDTNGSVGVGTASREAPVHPVRNTNAPSGLFPLKCSVQSYISSFHNAENENREFAFKNSTTRVFNIGLDLNLGPVLPLTTDGDIVVAGLHVQHTSVTIRT